MYRYSILLAFVIFAVASSQTPPTEHECRLCEFVIAIARHHFHNNITDEGALKTQLLAECGHISNANDQTLCKTIVNNNIDKIFSDLKNGDRSSTTCVDINYCTPAETGFPHFTGTFPTRGPVKVRRHRRQAPQTTENPRRLCHECDRLIGYAEYFYHHNPNATQAQVQAELEHECNRDPNQQQAAQCVTWVDAHIATIYNDLKAGKRPFQICEDLKLCEARLTTAAFFDQ